MAGRTSLPGQLDAHLAPKPSFSLPLTPSEGEPGVGSVQPSCLPWEVAEAVSLCWPVPVTAESKSHPSWPAQHILPIHRSEPGLGASLSSPLCAPVFDTKALHVLPIGSVTEWPENRCYAFLAYGVTVCLIKRKKRALASAAQW